MASTLDHRHIDRHVSAAIKTRVVPDDAALEKIIAGVGAAELTAFWRDFVSTSARRQANRAREWQSRDQISEFESAYARLHYDTTKPTSSERAFRAHVLRHLRDHIQAEQGVREAFESLPWYERWHKRLLMAFVASIWITTLAVIPLFMADTVFHFHILKRLGPIIEGVFLVAWGGLLGCVPLFAIWNVIRKWVRR